MSEVKKSNGDGQGVTIRYDDQIVRWFMLASILWGVVGMGVGTLVATQLNFWRVNFDLEWLTFGRLRPLHTNAAIFAFVGNMMFAGIYHSTQRLCKARLGSDLLSKIHFYGWQLIIVAAAITLPLGFSRGKEYGELIWPINIAVAVIWVIFGINFFWTIAKRNEKTLYVALWFYVATIVTVAMLYVVNHLSLPTSFLHSYPLFGGVQDALVQWWYGHNAVAFFLTTPILGIMYYYVPKAADRPVYSYRLSVVHFWSLVFIYIWAGPHHLLNTALPYWLQILGVLFSLMLWAPSWGGMINGLLTLRGAWEKLMKDPVLKFFAAGITFYGMSTFEGPLLSIRAVNALGHYTDWIIGHVHGGTLGWNGFMAAGMFYWMAPRLWKTKLYSVPLANAQFWIGTIGILLYVASMWVSGIMQGLMLNATNEDGTILTYPNFMDTLMAIRPMMAMRIVGGGLYLIGWFILVYNIWMTIRGKEVVDGEVTVYPEKGKTEVFPSGKLWLHPIPGLIFLTTAAFVLWMFGKDWLMIAGLVLSFFLCLVMLAYYEFGNKLWGIWYDRLLANSLVFTLFVLVAVALGGLLQIIPTVIVEKATNVEDRLQIPYTPLELAGRDIYVSEGCYNCHSQMIRTLVPDVMRYGDYSRLGESIYDHPFQWGSRRTGPDLARVGGRYPDVWHFNHMMDPRLTSPGSNMPSYPWLFEKDTDYGAMPSKIDVMRTLGVPYPEWTEAEINASLNKQANAIAENLKNEGALVRSERQIVALIAYLQKLGKYEDKEGSNKDVE